MYKGQTVFLQLTDHLPRRTFRRLVKRYNANHRVRTFTCWEQFLAMAFGQLTYRESPRASARPTTWRDDSSLPSSSRRGNFPRPYSSNPRFFTYLALPCIMLPCIMLLCTLG
jgi:Domain of unknown function (DUF4372)